MPLYPQESEVFHMKTNCVISIGRQFGSGGRYVGRMLAEKLGIPFYDKELLSEAAKQSGICEEIFEDHDEKPTRSLLFNLVTGMQVQHIVSAAADDDARALIGNRADGIELREENLMVQRHAASAKKSSRITTKSRPAP